jgi:amidohydrolase
MDLPTQIEKLSNYAIDFRHCLHQIPELLFEEHKTAAAIRGELDRLGIEYVAGVENAPTATVALLGDPRKPCVALRADIDGLPILEKTGAAYSSTHPGRMHACGHDGHSAILMGVATVLKPIADELNVCVKLIWQPAEEGGGGAERLVQAGVLDGRILPPVQAIFGLHGWPGLKLGTVATKAGVLLAATDVFKATFIGRGSHAAYPHLGRDPIVTACEAVLNLQQFVSREYDPTESAVVTVGMIHAGTATNVIPEQAVIEGTARTLTTEGRLQIAKSIERRCAGIAAANDCKLKFDWEPGYPATVNDPEMADYVAAVAKSALGSSRFVPVSRPSMGGEDFAYYLEKIPGCYFLLGMEPGNRTDYPSLHSDRYDFTDAAVPVGMRMFVELVQRYTAR